MGDVILNTKEINDTIHGIENPPTMQRCACCASDELELRRSAKAHMGDYNAYIAAAEQTHQN
jgi:hypothetical protein